MTPGRYLNLLISAALLCSPALAQDPKDQPADPLETTVIEKTGARLVQIDVTLVGPDEALENMTRDDFRVAVGGKKLLDFEVDKLCREPGGGGTTTVQPGTIAQGEEPPPPVPTLGPTTYLFYFDQPHLTQGGRQRGLDLVRELVPKLVDEGNRASVVSNGARLEALTDVTTDTQIVLDALDRLEKDHDHWDTFASEEEKRLLEILEALQIDYNRALSVARLHQSEELWRSERDLRRFSIALGRLATVEPPKVVVYLADTMRSNAGEHYLKLFSQAAQAEIAADTREHLASPDQAFGALLPFDQVVNEAASHGVRLYTIEAQGLVSASSRVPSTVRIKDAQHTLAGLAAETGGRAFLNGVRATKIAEQIRSDLSCLYLISFDPAGLDEDEPLAVRVNVERPKVKAHVRGRLVIQSESTALTSRLLSAFAAPETAQSAIPVRPTLIPTGYEDGTFSALVQVAVPRSDVPASTWDLGASIVSRGKVRKTSGRLTVSSAGAPVVLQESMTFRPGPFEIVAVAHNTTLDTVSSQQIEGAFPKLNAERVSIGPMAVLQPTNAAIRNGDEVKTSGAVAFAEDEPVRVDRPTAVVALICQSRDQRGVLQVERNLVGETPVPFEPIELDLRKDGCALIQDLVSSGTMTPGAFRYDVHVMQNGKEISTGEKRFLAWDATASTGAEISRARDGAP